jgi:hypothetical protein
LGPNFEPEEIPAHHCNSAGRVRRCRRVGAAVLPDALARRQRFIHRRHARHLYDRDRSLHVSIHRVWGHRGREVVSSLLDRDDPDPPGIWRFGRMDGPRIAAHLPTPWLGVTERVNIYLRYGWWSLRWSCCGEEGSWPDEWRQTMTNLGESSSGQSYA